MASAVGIAEKVQTVSRTVHSVTAGLVTLSGETACIAAGFVNSGPVLEMDVRPIRKNNREPMCEVHTIYALHLAALGESCNTTRKG